MYKKLNLKVLIVLVIALLGIVLLIDRWDAKKGQRSFKQQLVAFDTANVSGFLLYPEVNGNQEIALVKSGSGWMVDDNGNTYPADLSMVKSMLTELSDLKPKRIAATEKSKWGEFEVSDSTGTRVKVLDGDDIIADLFIGKFSFNQEKRSITSYVRIAGEDEIYAVEGYLKMMFNSDVNNLRDKTVVGFIKENVSTFTYNYPVLEDSWTLDKSSGKWMINGMPADSVEVEKFLNELASYKCSDFADGINKDFLGTADQSLVISGNMMNPVYVNLYRQDSLTAFVHSSMNDDALFTTGQGNIESSLFPPATRFLVVKEE